MKHMPNPALNLAPFARWTLRDKAQRSAPYLQRYASEMPSPLIGAERSTEA
jgi:hypothetical protein